MSGGGAVGGAEVPLKEIVHAAAVVGVLAAPIAILRLGGGLAAGGAGLGSAAEGSKKSQ